MPASLSKNQLLLTTLLSSVFGLAGCSSLSPNMPQNALDTSKSNIAIERHLYAGLGLGPSRMEPDTSQLTNTDVNDRVAAGGQITIGMDLNRLFALELHSADLGSAGVSPSGRVNYHIHGASALLYAGKNRDNYRRQGLSGYGRVGLGIMENSIDGNIPYEQVNKTHLLTGAGIEYMTRHGLGLRAEGILFDQDARYAQLAVVYRTGKRKQSKPVEIVKAPAPVVPPPIPAVAIVKQPVPVVPVPAPQPVDTCNEITGVLDGVNFRSNSEQLTSEATKILDGIATRLAECESVPVRISAHTDSHGAKKYNFDLSKRRAASVVSYLGSRGIAAKRLEAQAYGEMEPIDTNATSEGRKRNRRVELTTIK